MEDNHLHAALPEQIFRPRKGAILAHDHVRDAIQKTCPGTHDAWTQRADQRQLRPITATSRISDTSGFGVRGWTPALHAQVMASGDHSSLRIREHRSDR